MKRQSDTRLRREVVGQMMDYAANASQYWPASFLQRQFEARCVARQLDPLGELRSFFASDDLDANTLWHQVEARLREGEMRLVFFADEVPKELQRIVEFLNSETSKTEILAIEVRRYAGGEFSTHVQRLFRQTAEATDAKAGTRQGSGCRKWDEQSSFYAAIALTSAIQKALRDLKDLAKEPDFAVRWRTGAARGSLNVVIPNVCPRSIVYVFTDETLVLPFGWLPDAARDRLATLA